MPYSSSLRATQPSEQQLSQVRHITLYASASFQLRVSLPVSFMLLYQHSTFHSACFRTPFAEAVQVHRNRAAINIRYRRSINLVGIYFILLLTVNGSFQSSSSTVDLPPTFPAHTCMCVCAFSLHLRAPRSPSTGLGPSFDKIFIASFCARLAHASRIHTPNGLLYSNTLVFHASQSSPNITYENWNTNPLQEIHRAEGATGTYGYAGNG